MKEFDESVENVHLNKLYNQSIKISDNLISSFNKRSCSAEMDHRIDVKLAKQRKALFESRGIDKNGLELLEDYDHDNGSTSIKSWSLKGNQELAQELGDDDSSRDDASVSFSDSSDEQDS